MKRPYGNIFHLHFFRNKNEKNYSLNLYTNEDNENKIKSLEDKLNRIRKEK